MTLQEAFAEVEDHRRGPARQHDLKEMIVMSICAVLCGADSWVDVADWCEGEEDWLKTFLVLAHGTPSHDTFGNVFRVLDATVFERCFRCWVASIVGVAEGVVALDGKTLRGSKDGPNTAVHMVSAYATALGDHWDRKASQARAMNWRQSKRYWKPWYSRAVSSPSTRWGARQRLPRRLSARGEITSWR